MNVSVRMTETVTYEVDLPQEEFAALIGEDRDTPYHRLEEIAQASPDGDYGVEGATDLLDYVIEPSNVSITVDDRSWWIEFPDSVPRIKAPQHEPEWTDEPG